MLRPWPGSFLVQHGDPFHEDDLDVVLDHQHGAAVVSVHGLVRSESPGTSAWATPVIDSSSRIIDGSITQLDGNLQLVLVPV